MGIDEGPRVIREKRFDTGEGGGADQEAAVEAELAGDVEQVAFDPLAGASAFMQGDPELHDEAGLAAVVVGVGGACGVRSVFRGREGRMQVWGEARLADGGRTRRRVDPILRVLIQEISVV